MNGSQNGRSAELMSAIQNQQIGIVRRLLREGASPHARDGHGFPALCLAAHLDDYECVRALLDAGADASVRDFGTYTPLMYAGSAKVAQSLLDAGADVNAESDNCQTPLTTAVTSVEAPEVVQVLLACGAKVPDSMQEPGFWTRYGDRIEPVRRMLNAHVMANRLAQAMGESAPSQSKPSEVSVL